METIEGHKHVSLTLVYTWRKRFKDGGSGDQMEETQGRLTKKDDKLINRVMDVISEDRHLIVLEAWYRKIICSDDFVRSFNDF